jgi:hypothetical protein
MHTLGLVRVQPAGTGARCRRRSPCLAQLSLSAASAPGGIMTPESTRQTARARTGVPRPKSWPPVEICWTHDQAWRTPRLKPESRPAPPDTRKSAGGRVGPGCVSESNRGQRPRISREPSRVRSPKSARLKTRLQGALRRQCSLQHALKKQKAAARVRAAHGRRAGGGAREPERRT